MTPNQPNIQFPKSAFGLTHRFFKYSWFKDHPWLEWDSEVNEVVCHSCRMAEKLDEDVSDVFIFKMQRRSLHYSGF